MRRVAIGMLGGVLAGVAAAAPAPAQQTSGLPAPFDWTGQLPPGGQVRVIDLHGDIRVTPASGDQIVVHAEVRQQGGRHRAAIVFDVIRDGNAVILCARRASGPACTPRGMQDQNDDDEGTPASADFAVQLPRGLGLDAETGNGVVDVTGTGTDVRVSSGNGALRVAGASGTVHASSGNGDVTVDNAGGLVTASTGNGTVRASTAAGPISASSGNGDIDVRMQTLGAHGPMEFSTGNGTVTVAVPASFAGELDANTGHGRIECDFPYQLQGRIDPSHVHASINGGGSRVRMSTGNGDLVLRKI